MQKLLLISSHKKDRRQDKNKDNHLWKNTFQQYITDFKENNPGVPVEMINYWSGDDDSEGEAENKDVSNKEEDVTEEDNTDYNLYNGNKLKMMSNKSQMSRFGQW